MTMTKTQLVCQRNEDVSKKIRTKKSSSKVATKDIRTFLKIAEKRVNGENEQVQENVPVDSIEVD